MANSKKSEPRNLCEVLDELLDSFAAAAEETAEQERIDRMTEKKEQFDEAAMDMHMIYDSFVEAGFSEVQAFNLLCVLIGKH